MHPSHLHYFPLPPIVYAILLGVLFAVFVLIQLGLLRYAYTRIGLSSRAAMLVLLASLLGSYVNIPVAQLPEEHVRSHEAVEFFGSRYELPVVVDWPGTIVAVNVGGAVIPAALSFYLLARHGLWLMGAITTAIVAAVVHSLAHLVPGVGIAVPMFAPPLVTAAAALLMSRQLAAPLAYIGGSLGTLIGADLLNLGNLGGLEAPVASIGGAGTFDGVFLTGVIAVLLAGLGGGKPHAATTSSA